MLKRLGIIDHLYARPLFRGLAEPRDGPRFDLVRDVPAQLARKLRQRHLDGAFLSPIDYARDYSLYGIIPKCLVASAVETSTVALFFKEHIREIRTVAVDATSASEVVLAHLILREKYDITPRILPIDAPLEAALGQADAALVVGDACRAKRGVRNKIDLIDEWEDLTGLPFALGLWVARDGALAPKEMNAIIRSASRGAAAIEKVAEGEERDYLSSFVYEQTEEVLQGLTEFFRMAYYHGILPDIPELTFHDVGGRD